MTVEFEHRTRISAPIEVVFDLSMDIDAHMASMADSKERAIGGVTTASLGSARRSPGRPGTSASRSQ